MRRQAICLAFRIPLCRAAALFCNATSLRGATTKEGSHDPSALKTPTAPWGQQRGAEPELVAGGVSVAPEPPKAAALKGLEAEVRALSSKPFDATNSCVSGSYEGPTPG